MQRLEFIFDIQHPNVRVHGVSTSLVDIYYTSGFFYEWFYTKWVFRVKNKIGYTLTFCVYD